MGLFVLFIGTIFKTMHWAGWHYLLMCGTTQETIFTALTLTEILTSKRLRKFRKVWWALAYLALPSIAFFGLRTELFLLTIFIIGTFYVSFGRKRFVHHRKNPMEHFVAEVAEF